MRSASEFHGENRRGASLATKHVITSSAPCKARMKPHESDEILNAIDKHFPGKDLQGHNMGSGHNHGFHVLRTMDQNTSYVFGADLYWRPLAEPQFQDLAISRRWTNLTKSSMMRLQQLHLHTYIASSFIPSYSQLFRSITTNRSAHCSHTRCNKHCGHHH